jgi:glycosyltransferase involved in cell wall biosynthesis
LKLSVISSKKCWEDNTGKWYSSGGFPVQMTTIGSLFSDITLLVLRGESKAGGIPLPEKARVIALPEPAGRDFRRKLSVVFNQRFYFSQIRKILKEADVVHVPLPGDLSFLGFMAALLSGKPLIARYCGSWQDTANATIMNRVTKTCMRIFAGGRRVMLATGVGNEPPAPRMNWIFSTALSATELAKIRPVLDRGLRNPARLVYIGRLSEEKGVIFLIQAIRRLKEEGFKHIPQVTIIGDGPERSSLEGLVREVYCTDVIHFTGQLDRTTLSNQLLQADLCIQPSLTEGYSKAWLDAMLHGLPLVASDVGAARFVIGAGGERGWLVPPGNAEALANQIHEIINGTVDWPALRKRCRRYVEGHTLEVWAEEIGQICARQWSISLVEGRLKA